MMARLTRIALIVGLGISCGATCVLPLTAEEPGNKDTLRDAMRRLAETAQIELADGAQAELAAAPVFRYSDQPRRIVDATLWVWKVQGRPVALQKVEAVDRPDGPGWTVCFGSLSTGLLEVEWPSGQRLECSQPGVAFDTLPDPPPIKAAAVKPLHMRQVARRFAARIVNDPQQNNTEQMRLLARPILEYADSESGLLAGAVFGFASNGTNPDAYLILEAEQGSGGDVAWRYGWVRMTSGGVTALLDDEPVWSCDWVRPAPIPYENWMFFRLDRE